MKTLMFMSLGILGVVLMMFGNKKNIIDWKGLNIYKKLIFYIQNIMLESSMSFQSLSYIQSLKIRLVCISVANPYFSS